MHRALLQPFAMHSVKHPPEASSILRLHFTDKEIKAQVQKWPRQVTYPQKTLNLMNIYII